MTSPSLSIQDVNRCIEPFEDRIDILFHELELATKWQRPSVLLAIYSSEYVRADADIALENRLHNLGQSTYHIKIKNQKNSDVSLLISELANLSNVVFFVEGLHRGSGEEQRCTYHMLNKSREFFIENQIRVVFWLTENEAIDLAHYAPDYWSFRHRVIEFVDSPKPEQISPHVLESAWQGVGEFAEATEDLDAKIALRIALLSDLPDGSESTSARANLLLTLGMLHWRKGNNEQAHQFLNTALDMSAGLEDCRFEALCFNALALVETDLGRAEEAIQAYQNAIKLAPEKISPWNNLGNLFRKLERYEEALAAFQKAVEQNKSDAVGWNGLGNLYHDMGRNDDAIYAFLKAVEFSPHYAPCWSGLGNSYLAGGQLEDAVKAHLKAIEIDRHSFDSWFALGDIYKLQGKDEDASMAYRSVIEMDPHNTQALSKLGDLHHITEATADTLQPEQKAVASDQGCLLSCNNLASIYIDEQHYAEAVPLLQKSIELSNDITDTVCLWNRLGDAYRHLEDNDHAMDAYNHADLLNAKAAATPAVATSDLPDLQSSLNEDILLQPDSTSQPGCLSEQALEPVPAEPVVAGADSLPGKLEPAFISWLDGFAAAMASFHQHQAAGADPAGTSNMGQFEKDLQLEFVQPEADYPAYTKDESILPATKDTASWYEPLPEFVDNDSPSDPLKPAASEPAVTIQTETPLQTGTAVEEENAHLWNELGSIYLNTGAYDEAINAFQKAIELDRSYGWSYNNLAALYSRQGRYKDAIAFYKKGLQYLGETGDKALLWNRLGDTYRRLNQRNRAAAAYRKAMQLDPDNVSLLTRARFSLLGNCRV
jgi:tetratricopeptide (TPR) repeat protein